MFVSRPEYEFPIPSALGDPGSQHWRMMELSLHAPWFLLSVEVVDPDVPDLGITRTLCVAWEHDLADVLRSLEAERVKGIVCMMPSWQSPAGQWWSREIREVWIYSSPGGMNVVLADTTGEKFNCSLMREHVGDAKMDLLLRVDPKSAGNGPNRQTRRAAARHRKKSS